MVLAGTVLAVFLTLYDIDLFRHHLPDVQGNLEASVIWGTPTAIAFFVRSEMRHRTAEAAARARHDERMQALGELHAKLDAVHEHLGIKPSRD